MTSYTLGISAFYHDAAACLLADGKIIAAAQEERFTRKRHDENFPSNAVDYCLKYANITAADLSCVAFYDKPWIKFERLLETYLAFAPSGFGSFIKAAPIWLKEKLWMGDLIKRELSFEGQLIYPEHHQSHAASAFFPSPFQEAAVLTIDGVGEWSTASWGVGKDHQLDIKAELSFPHSLGLLYSAFTYYTGFKVNSGEYKVMGLAPYGEPKYVDKIFAELIDVKEDGSFFLNMEYFNYCQGLTMTSEKFHQLFGAPPRKPESPLSQREMDLARSVQVVTEEVVLKIAAHIRKETGLKALCLAGGVALNCVSNGKLIQSKIFDDVWIQPAAGDAGGALGAAAFAWHTVLKNPRKVSGKGDSQDGSLLGPAFSKEDIKSWLDSEGLPYEDIGSNYIKEVATVLAKGKIVGWFSGRMEFGPRALGARSILGDPRNPEMQKTMNLKIKFRESFRPFAPIVLREDVSKYFAIDGDSPYMLVVAELLPKYRLAVSKEDEALFGIDKLNVPRSTLPAVTHVDFSARLQTVDGQANPQLHSLLTEFKHQTGVGILVNTSFNVRGEPIVCTPQDAYRCFMRTNIDVLAIEGLLLRKEAQPKFADSENWQETFELD